MSAPAIVVVLTGKAAGKVGVIRGQDFYARYPSSNRVLVRFPAEEYPNDFRSIRADNLRPATGGEALVANA